MADLDPADLVEGDRVDLGDGVLACVADEAAPVGGELDAAAGRVADGDLRDPAVLAGAGLGDHGDDSVVGVGGEELDITHGGVSFSSVRAESRTVRNV
ncbi:hypothetical protein, partial [Streptomyces sp. Root1295]